LTKPGYDFDDAFTALPSTEQFFLNSEEHSTLENLRRLVPKKSAGKKLIDHISQEPLSRKIYPDKDKALSLIDKRIKELSDNLGFFFWTRSTRSKKIKLLDSLRKKLDSRESFEEAITHIPKDAKANKQDDNFHLLFDGRTGETMKTIRTKYYNESLTEKQIKNNTEFEEPKSKNQR
jgi:hypothetical protein